jgi:hypothetical protein
VQLTLRTFAVRFVKKKLEFASSSVVVHSFRPSRVILIGDKFPQLSKLLRREFSNRVLDLRKAHTIESLTAKVLNGEIAVPAPKTYCRRRPNVYALKRRSCLQPVLYARPKFSNANLQTTTDMNQKIAHDFIFD